jgi:hypothetical protein
LASDAGDRPPSEDGLRGAAPSPRRRGAERRGEGGRAGRRGARRAIVPFLLVSLVPAAAVGWFLLQPEATRQDVLDRIPEGVGGRVLVAAIALAVLVVLARVALPTFRGASTGLRGLLDRFRRRRRVVRILLLPLEFATWLLWFLVQVLFAVDAVLVLAAALLVLLLAVRVLRPDFLPDVLPQLTR